MFIWKMYKNMIFAQKMIKLWLCQTCQNEKKPPCIAVNELVPSLFPAWLKIRPRDIFTVLWTFANWEKKMSHILWAICDQANIIWKKKEKSEKERKGEVKDAIGIDKAIVTHSRHFSTLWRFMAKVKVNEVLHQLFSTQNGDNRKSPSPFRHSKTLVSDEEGFTFERMNCLLNILS